jgi:hypothetical protein
MVVMTHAAAVMWAAVKKRELVIAVASYWLAQCYGDAELMSQVTSYVMAAD